MTFDVNIIIINIIFNLLINNNLMHKFLNFYKTHISSNFHPNRSISFLYMFN